MNIIVALCFCADDAHKCESLLDLCAALNHNEPTGTILLVAAPDTHPEMQEKLRIAAELAFAIVEVLPVPWPTKTNQVSKYYMVNHCFRMAATTVAERFQWPFLWLESDCVPLKSNWISLIRDAYVAQPHKYLNAHMSDPNGRMSADRVGVYPMSAILQLATFFEQDAPFNLQAGDVTIKRSTKSKLFQVMRYTAETERSKVREDAVLLHGDKEGVLLEMVRKELKSEFKYPVKIETIAEVITDPDFAEHAEPSQLPPLSPPPPSLNANDPPKRKPGRPAGKKSEPVAA